LAIKETIPTGIIIGLLVKELVKYIQLSNRFETYSRPN
jgi:hypothetical protein